MIRGRRSAAPLAGATAAALAGLACGEAGESDELREAIPAAEDLRIDVPGQDAGESEGALRLALIGERAALYQVTRDVSRAVNGGVAGMLLILHAVVRHEPTSREEGRATWGPWNETLSPVAYLFAVERTAAREYDYRLRVRPRDAGDEAWSEIVRGHTRLRAGGVAGTLEVDLEAAHGVDAGEHPGRGRLAADYDAARGGPRRLDVIFDGAAFSADETAIDAVYHYDQAADGSGTFLFEATADLDDDGSAAEDLRVASRWRPDGAGRGDVAAERGDIPSEVSPIEIAECWDRRFARVYYADSIALAPSEGDPTDCAFSDRLDPDAPVR